MVNYHLLKLLKELERITSLDLTEAAEEWEMKWAPKIIHQFKLEAETCSRTKNSYAEINSQGTLLLYEYLLDKRHRKYYVIYFVTCRME